MLHSTLLLIPGLLFAMFLLVMLGQKLGISYPIFLVLGGLGLSFMPGLPRVTIAPDLIFLIFLPPLLYEAAWTTAWNNFWRWRRPIAPLLGLPGRARRQQRGQRRGLRFQRLGLQAQQVVAGRVVGQEGPGALLHQQARVGEATPVAGRGGLGGGRGQGGQRRGQGLLPAAGNGGPGMEWRARSS